MVPFDKCGYKRIRKYSKYIVKENLCSIERTIEKVTTMIRTVIKDIDGNVIYICYPHTSDLEILKDIDYMFVNIIAVNHYRVLRMKNSQMEML